MEIIEKKVEWPFVGYYQNGVIEVGADLTAPERAFVVAHEYCHSTEDKPLWWVWREARATIYPLLGFVMLCFRFLPRLPSYAIARGQR